MLEDKILKKVNEKIENIVNSDITTSNLDNLYKLSKIKHIVEEGESMNYGNYGRYDERYGHDEYGRYDRDNYGARRRDSRGRYMGHEHLDRMYDDYGRYMESRERYGASEETNKSFHYMLKSLEDFIKVLHEEANTQQEKQQLRETLQRSMM